MTNRHERRAAKKRNRRAGDFILIERSHLLERDPNYGASLNCYICDTPHKARGIARIQDNSGTTNVPLCEPCLHDPDAPEAIVWRFWHAPNLILSEGGEATHEQILALAEKQRATVN
jgi:hypothetical protein